MERGKKKFVIVSLIHFRDDNGFIDVSVCMQEKESVYVSFVCVF